MPDGRAAAMRPEDHESDRLYCNIFQYAKGVATNVTIFSSSLGIFIRDRLWEKGWYDRVDKKLRYAPSLTEFLKRPVPDGAGTSAAWIYGVLHGPADLNDASAISAIARLDAGLKAEGQPYSKEAFEHEYKVQVPEAVSQPHDEKGRFSRSSNTTTGRGSSYLLARLKRDRPDLAQRVIDGNLSANAAAIEAGIRKALTPLEQILRLLPKLTANEQHQLHNELCRLLNTHAEEWEPI